MIQESFIFCLKFNSIPLNVADNREGQGLFITVLYDIDDLLMWRCRNTAGSKNKYDARQNSNNHYLDERQRDASEQ